MKEFSASELGSIAIKGLLEKHELKPYLSDKTKSYRPEKLEDVERTSVEKKYMEWKEDFQDIEIDELIMGNVLQGGQGQNPARQASIKAGIPREVPSYTVNKVCGSGMKAVTLASESIMLGDSDVIIAGGMESMTNTPYVLPKARWGYRMDLDTKGELRDLMVLDGLHEIFYGYHMGVTAENLAEDYNISREEQDRLAAESQNRALKANEKGIFEDEMIQVEAKDGTIHKDETPRDTNMEKLSKLPPAFKENGTVTAGNSSGISDGAAALLLTSKEYAEEHGLNILGYVGKSASAGVDPAYMGLGPVASTRKLFDITNTDEADIDVIEENEAFAAQILATMEEMDTPRYGIGINEEGSEDINPHGSGISLGHPIGCTAARMIVTLIHELKRRKDDVGLASLCIGGGMGMSIIIER